MPKTPEQILKELDDIAQQAQRDAEIVRAHIESQKAFKALQDRLAGNDTIEHFETANLHEDKEREEEPLTIKQAVINYLKSQQGAFIKSDHIKEAVIPMFPGKPAKSVGNRVRDILSDGDDEIVRAANNSGRGYLYGAKTWRK